MIPELERNTRNCPRGVCFLFEGRTYVNAQIRLQAAGLARALQLQGVRRGSFVACDMDNSPALVLLAVAAGYGGFALVALNRRLTDAEKDERLSDLERNGYHVAARLDETAVVGMLHEVSDERTRHVLRHHAERFAAQFNLDDRAMVLFTSGTSGRAKAVELTWRNLVGSANASNEHLAASPTDVWQLALPLYHIGGFQIMVRSILAGCSFVLYRRFEVERVMTDAARYAVTHISVVDKMLQDMLAWADADAEDDDAEVVGAHARHANGTQRTVHSGHAAEGELSGDRGACDEGAADLASVRHLSSLRGRHASYAQAVALHASREDADRLRRFRTVAESANVLAGYRCILLGGAAPNPRTLQTAVAAGARVYASYGMTETSSQIASTLVTKDFSGKLDLLPGYRATVVAPDADGMGQLAVSGPGVCAGYLNARAAFTVDGYFLTGDRASVRRRTLQVAERTDDMFVSGGENVYPAEIQRKLLFVPGVTDAYVFGVLDSTWGRRPVAIVERSPRAARQAVQRVLRASEERLRDPYGDLADLSVRPGLAAGTAGRLSAFRAQGANSTFPRAHSLASAVSGGVDAPSDERLAPEASVQRFAEGVKAALGGSLSKVYLPEDVLVVEEFPRTGIGKVDRAALRRAYEERICVERVEVFRVKQPLQAPIHTAKTTLEERESLLVRVTDHEGRTGIAEGVAFSTDWYLPETLDEDERILREELIPCVLAGTYAHPRQVIDALLECPGAHEHPLACGALEPALWDLYGKIVRKPLWQLIGGAPYGGRVVETEVADEKDAGKTHAPGSISASPVMELEAGDAPEVLTGECAMPSDTEPTSEGDCQGDFTELPEGAFIGAREQAHAGFAAGGDAHEPARTLVPGGAVFGLMPTDDLVRAVESAAAQGFVRAKLKIAPGQDVEPVRAVRLACPDVELMVDANQSYDDAREAERVIDELAAFGVRCVEEPLKPREGEGLRDLFERLSRLQELVRVPLCLDESVTSYDDLRLALSFPKLHWYAIKIAKFGGVGPALSFCEWAERHEVSVWMGGMYDTGISKRLHAAFETLPCCALPGDLSDSDRYFPQDVAKPAFRLRHGHVELNGPGHEYGLGCVLNEEVLARITVSTTTLER